MSEAAVQRGGWPRLVNVSLGGRPTYRLAFSEEDVRLHTNVRDIAGTVLRPIQHDDGTKDFEPVGTAFKVTEPFSRGGGYHFYLVTAQHVLDDAGEEFTIRFNAVRHEEGLGHTDTIHRRADWFVHPKGAGFADVAVSRFNRFPGMLYRGIDVRQAAVKADDFYDRRIACGDECSIVGLFSNVPDNAAPDGDQIVPKHNIPIVRTGHIAGVDYFGEPIRIRSGMYDMDVYLVEARSIGGLSGSPVLIRPPQDEMMLSDPRNEETLLVGLVHGHFNAYEKGDPEHPTENTSTKPKRINTGIAAVVPAARIVEILDRPELIAMRKKAESEHQKDAGIELDSVPRGKNDKNQDDAPTMTPEELIRRAVNTPPLPKKPAKKSKPKKT